MMNHCVEAVCEALANRVPRLDLESVRVIEPPAPPTRLVTLESLECRTRQIVQAREAVKHAFPESKEIGNPGSSGPTPADRGWRDRWTGGRDPARSPFGVRSRWPSGAWAPRGP